MGNALRIWTMTLVTLYIGYRIGKEQQKCISAVELANLAMDSVVASTDER